MRLINYNYDKILSINEPMVIYVFSDTHLGNIGFDEALLKKHIRMCLNENANWVHLGDWVEAVAPKDKRYDVRHTANPILNQYEDIIELFEPIKEKGIAILSGNHDEKIARDYGDFIAMISRRLGVPYLGYEGFINIRTKITETGKPYNHIMFLHHGHGAGRMLGSKGNNLQRMSGKYDADIYGIGHIHTLLSHIDTRLELRRNNRNIVKFRNKKRYYFACPSYFNAYTDCEVPNYAEKAAFQPQTVGCLRLELRMLSVDRNWELDVRIQPLLG